EPPTSAVFPSADNPTPKPRLALPLAPVPVSLPPCCVHTPAVRVNTHAAPAKPLSNGAPIRPVLPSAERATSRPKPPMPTAPPPVSFPPCCVQTPAVRVKAQAAPTVPLSSGPPMRPVFPSAERASEDGLAGAGQLPTLLRPHAGRACERPH